MRITKKLRDLFGRYNVVVRDADQTVTHLTYGHRTVLKPEQFAVYEAAIKSHYVATAIHFHLKQDYKSFAGCQAYYMGVADKNGIPLPWINDGDGRERAGQAADDYLVCQDVLMGQTGRDATTGQPRNAHYATLD